MLQIPLAPVSWQRMDRAIERVKERLLRAAKALERAGVPYAVIGGNAVAAWVSRADEAAVRNTRDVDLLLRRKDFAAADVALTEVGFVHPKVAMLGQGGSMDVFLDGPEAKVREAVHILWAGERVRAESLEAAPDVTDSEDVGEFQLIALPALAHMKLTAFGDKDRMHLRDLLDVGLIHKTWLLEMPPGLRERLQLLLDTPE